MLYLIDDTQLHCKLLIFNWFLHAEQSDIQDSLSDDKYKPFPH